MQRKQRMFYNFSNNANCACCINCWPMSDQFQNHLRANTEPLHLAKVPPTEGSETSLRTEALWWGWWGFCALHTLPVFVVYPWPSMPACPLQSCHKVSASFHITLYQISNFQGLQNSWRTCTMIQPELCKLTIVNLEHSGKGVWNKLPMIIIFFHVQNLSLNLEHNLIYF